MQMRSDGGVEALALGVVEQRPVHRRHAVEVGDPVALHRLQRFAGVEFGHQREAGADPSEAFIADRLAEGVEERQGAEDDVAGADLAGRAGGDVGVAGEVGVGQLGALRLAGRARGVEDHRGVVLGGVGEAGRRLERGEQRRRRRPARPRSARRPRRRRRRAPPRRSRARRAAASRPSPLGRRRSHAASAARSSAPRRRRRAARRSRRPGTRARWAASPRPGRPARRPSRASRVARRALRRPARRRSAQPRRGGSPGSSGVRSALSVSSDARLRPICVARA